MRKYLLFGALTLALASCSSALEEQLDQLLRLLRHVTRTALSYYTDDIDEDWILDDYGIRGWVESLPVRSISMASLASYKIIGL